MCECHTGTGYTQGSENQKNNLQWRDYRTE